MWGRIFKVILSIFVAIIILFIAIIVDGFIPVYKGYLSFTMVYAIIIYFMFRFFRFLSTEKEDENSLYMWLDNLAGSDELLKSLFLDEKSTNILNNLEKVNKKLNVLTQFNEKKLKLLQAYYKTLNDDGPLDLLNKTVLGIIVAIVITVITKGALWSISTFTGNTGSLNVSPNYITVLNYSIFIIEIFLFLIFFIKDYFKSKTRNKIILEILEVCIEEKG